MHFAILSAITETGRIRNPSRLPARYRMGAANACPFRITKFWKQSTKACGRGSARPGILETHPQPFTRLGPSQSYRSRQGPQASNPTGPPACPLHPAKTLRVAESTWLYQPVTGGILESQHSARKEHISMKSHYFQKSNIVSRVASPPAVTPPWHPVACLRAAPSWLTRKSRLHAGS